ncbi:hypothetical protein [Petroclostridium sp. X23]|uniref:hypothetical protein n=1 Tax=Petroclostridium sp. X23 TaxID=3045146 RepID=UPI0024ADEB9C|nr:hypothetical protein [Petroclostridium sp. X23]WHH59160.1 hypothetical protein QKW49_25800 [Petroclostridium sp. X23]
MPQMTDVDINFISLVKKGANKQKIQIYKSDDYEEPETEPVQKEEDELKGFFNVMKSFFTGKKEIAKAEAAKSISFADRMAVSEITDGLWRVNDTLSSTLRDILRDDTVPDKQAAMNTAIDEYAAYMKNKIKNVGKKVAKADEDFFMAEPVAKAGKKVSTARLTSIKNAIQSLQSIVSEVETEEGDGEVKKEEIVEIVKSAVTESVKPINERLDKIEKGDPADEQPAAEVKKEDIAEIVKSAVSESLKPIQERLTVVEKSRGISKADDDSDAGKGEEVKKSEGSFDGFFA